MRIEAEKLESLRKLVRELQAENTSLKKKLRKANIAYSESCIFEEKIEDSGRTIKVRTRSTCEDLFLKPIHASLARNFGRLFCIKVNL